MFHSTKKKRNPLFLRWYFCIKTNYALKIIHLICHHILNQFVCIPWSLRWSKMIALTWKLYFMKPLHVNASITDNLGASESMWEKWSVGNGSPLLRLYGLICELLNDCEVCKPPIFILVENLGCFTPKKPDPSFIGPAIARCDAGWDLIRVLHLLYIWFM